MSKYKVGDKVVLTVTSTNEMGCLPCYVLNDDLILSRQDIDKYSEPLSTYTEPLEDKIKKLTEENIRLIAENAKIKGTLCDVCKSDEFLNEMAESAREEGQKEAWELARNIILPPSKGGMSSDDYVAIFGSCISEAYVMKNYTYSEAAAKVAEWEKAKEEIKVGDVVKHNETEYTGIVTRVSEHMNKITIIFKDGSSESYDSSMFHKTGRHIDIDRFLNQIGEEQE